MQYNLNDLGNRILIARNACRLSQKELAIQAKISVKTLQDIEKGRKNPTYKTLARLIARLGICADSLFPQASSIKDDELQQFIGKFQTCNRENQQILLNTLVFLAEQLPKHQDERLSSVKRGELVPEDFTGRTVRKGHFTHFRID